jgi:outer membrane murein-binding lipoprotein Lpp
MSHRLPILKKLVVPVAALAFSLAVGCASGPSQAEMDALEKQRMAAEAAEQKVAELQAEKARLERKVAEKKASKQAADEKLAVIKKNMAQ